jgi:hypothetical protein
MNENKIHEPDLGVVYKKTEKGVEEMQTRKYNLPQKLRAILSVIDGNATVGFLLKQLYTMDGVATILVELEQQGFTGRIAKKTSAAPSTALSPDEERRVKMARTFMINTVTDAVGAMGSSLIDNLVKCATLKELQSHFENYLYIIASGRGKPTAEEYRVELSKLLFP